MARPHLTEPSRLLTVVRKHFADLGNAELAFVARTIARGHAAHVATLADAGPPLGEKRRAAYDKAKHRAAELDLAWSQLSTLFSLTDMEEEAHSSETATAQRLLAQVARALFDPDCLRADTKVPDLLPPREHLPIRIPEAIRPLYASAHPVRSRTRPPASAMTTYPAADIEAEVAKAKAFEATANTPGTLI